MGARRRLALLGVFVLVASTQAVGPAAASRSPGASRYAGAAGGPSAPALVRERPCPESIFTCVTLRMPRDHFGPAGGPTFDVTFGLLRASGGPRKGVFVTVTGGPGTSGLAAADGYTEAFDPLIAEQYDIVFFDQRGIGLSEPMQCLDAALDWYTSPHVPTVSAAEARAFAGNSRTFVGQCISESGVDRADLPFFSTRQAVEDLEAFRVWLGAPTLDLYGESYGTQFAQTYSAAHPDRLHSLMIDGPVDLTLTGTQYYAEDARAFDFVLTRTLKDCTADRVCRRDVTGRGSLEGYDALAAKLRRGPIAYSFIKANGAAQRRLFTLGDLETAAAGYVYENTDRMLLQRAIAWATRGQVLPLARLASISLGQDPDTLQAIPDPTWSDAMYYAVECMDYDYGTGTADQRAADYLAAGASAHVAAVRLGSVYYGDLPCGYWPVHPPPGRPGYLSSTAFPVFVLASSWDPATPFAGAGRIFDHLSDGYLIIQPGGPHIIFGRANACPDDLITAFLIDGDRPASRRTTCDFAGPEPYVPIPAARVASYPDAMAAMTAMDDEINWSADYSNWDGAAKLEYGCLFGGRIQYRPYADGYRVTLDKCAFSAGLALTGKATINVTNETFALTVTAPGGTKLTYGRDADGNRTVSGRWFGKAGVRLRLTAAGQPAPARSA
ncbi:MAG: alpha/beta hydrolase [Chloroflexota bacterium]|nr:alpha/beta hydrolase [Chloroflexota bacterium]